MNLAQAYRLGSHLLPYLPPSIGYWLCDRLSVMAPFVSAWPRIVANLQHVLPDAPSATHRRYARGIYSTLLKNYYDLLRAHACSAAELARWVDVQGMDNLREALARGKGAIVAIPHMGSISLAAAQAVTMLQTPVMVIAEQMRDPAIHTILKDLRQRTRIEIVEIGPQVARTILRALRAGKVVVLATDRTVADATVEVQFFGAPAPVPAGPATLALHTDAPLLTAYCYRRPDNRVTAIIDPPLALERRGNLQADVRRTMQAVTRILEAYIRRHPAQWLITELVWPAA